MPTLADGLVAISDALRVSSAPILGALDMLRLRKIVEQPRSTDHLLCALRRLSLSQLTLGLSGSTGVDGVVGGLVGHGDAAVRDLSAQVVRAWTQQLYEARKIERQKLKRGPKPAGTGDSTCRACRGAHRPHTCTT